ncbi:MAG: hypothetical protein NZL83_01105 [Candidatus Absconditabacterales bacterium]|nr:hypothetical protein [Candidatus Absconditabacterales bacterium]
MVLFYEKSTYDDASNIKNIVSCDDYIPADTEKKQAILGYLFIGLLLAVRLHDTGKKTPFLAFHLPYALGWWTIFFLVFVFCAPLLFLPFLWIFPSLLYCVHLFLYGRGVFNAYQGRGVGSNPITDFIHGLGRWIFSLFGVDFSLDVSDDALVERE